MQEASFTFSIPLSARVEQKADGEHLYTEGLISTNDIDLVDDVVTKNFLESMNKQIKERLIKMDLEHEAFKGKSYEEMEINKTKIPAGKIIESGVEDLGEGRFGLSVKTEVNRNRSDYKQIKGNLLEKYLDGYSIAFIATEVKYEKRGDKEVRLLDDGILLNTAYTGNACNTKAAMRDVFMKSMDALEKYKQMKENDPDYEKRLIVKNKEKKENPLSFIWNKIMAGEALDKKEIKLLKAAIDVVNNQGASKELEKEYFEKVSNGLKLTWKEYYIFRELIEVENQIEMPVMAEDSFKSQSSNKDVGLVNADEKLNSKNIKMNTDKKEDPKAPEGQEGNPEGQEGSENGSENVESKALNSLTADLKSLSEKYDAVAKDSADLKSSLNEIKEAVGKITEAMSKPIHGSPGVQPGDAKLKNNVEGKSVDPLALI